MGKVKAGDEFCCADCGLAVVVNTACGCVDTELLCCGEPMTKTKKSASAAKKPAAGKIPAKSAAKKVSKAH
jgi:hypothetical protein